MKALTIWQPWATLIMIGAKPYEFRKWDYRTRNRDVEGQRIIIHAGARRMHPGEVSELLINLGMGEETGLVHEPARELLVKVGFKSGDGGVQLPHGCALGTAIVGTPAKAFDIFKGKVEDSSRIDQHVWAWPLTDIQKFDEPIPMRGLQGFWNWPLKEAA